MPRNKGVSRARKRPGAPLARVDPNAPAVRLSTRPSPDHDVEMPSDSSDVDNACHGAAPTAALCGDRELSDVDEADDVVVAHVADDGDSWLRALLADVVDKAVDLQIQMNDRFIRYAAMSTACMLARENMDGPEGCSAAYKDAYESARGELECICCPELHGPWGYYTLSGGPHVHSPYHALSAKFRCSDCGTNVCMCTCLVLCECGMMMSKWSWQRDDLFHSNCESGQCESRYSRDRGRFADFCKLERTVIFNRWGRRFVGMHDPSDAPASARPLVRRNGVMCAECNWPNLHDTAIFPHFDKFS
jgi:hypothetical protein